MKKYTLLFVSLLVSCLMLAQGPANRTAKTIAADVLAQMPAQNQETFNSLMNDLASSGEEGILILTQMLKAPGQGSNAQVEYALSGLTSYVSAPGREAQQAVVLSALNKAAAQATNATVKAFLERERKKNSFINRFKRGFDSLSGELFGSDDTSDTLN